MGDMIDREAFIVMLTERYPAVAADIDECRSGTTPSGDGHACSCRSSCDQ